MENKGKIDFAHPCKNFCGRPLDPSPVAHPMITRIASSIFALAIIFVFAEHGSGVQTSIDIRHIRGIRMMDTQPKKLTTS